MLNKAFVLALAGFTLAAHADEAGRSYVLPPRVGSAPAAPFSEGIMVEGTFYVAGHIGLDSASGHPPAAPEAEARLVMDAVKATLEHAGLKPEDLVAVTVYCTDLDLYDQFNSIYRTYFHAHFPTRAFIGVNKLLRGAHFEISGIAVKPAGARKL
jgi:2-iminobutanoate/2-iminopropanoate deaminase